MEERPRLEAGGTPGSMLLMLSIVEMAIMQLEATLGSQEYSSKN